MCKPIHWKLVNWSYVCKPFHFLVILRQLCQPWQIIQVYHQKFSVFFQISYPHINLLQWQEPNNQNITPKISWFPKGKKSSGYSSSFPYPIYRNIHSDDRWELIRVISASILTSFFFLCCGLFLHHWKVNVGRIL